MNIITSRMHALTCCYILLTLIILKAESNGYYFVLHEGDTIPGSSSSIIIVKTRSPIECAVVCRKTPNCCVSSYERVNGDCWFDIFGVCGIATEVSQESMLITDVAKKEVEEMQGNK